MARRHRDLHLRRRHHHRASAAAAAHHADHADPDAGGSDAHDTDRDTDARRFPKPSVPSALKAQGGLGRAVVSWQPPTTNAAQVIGYQVHAPRDTTIRADAAGAQGRLQGAPERARRTPSRWSRYGTGGFVTPGGAPSPPTGTATTLTAAKSRRAGPGSRERSRTGPTGLEGQVLKVLAKQGGKWVKVGKVTTGKRREVLCCGPEGHHEAHSTASSSSPGREPRWAASRRRRHL